MEIRITSKYLIEFDDDNMTISYFRRSDGLEVPSPLGSSPKSYPFVKRNYDSLDCREVDKLIDLIFTAYYGEDVHETEMVA